MSLLLSRISRVSRGKSSMLVRSLLCNGFSTSLLQSPPCKILSASPCGADLGKLVIHNLNEAPVTTKKVLMELVMKDVTETIGSSHGWVATLKDDGILRLQDDFNPVASDTDPKRIPLPSLVTLPRCQTQMVTNVSMSSSCPEDDEDCVVAVKFLGPQISFCRPAQSNPEWTNLRIDNPCFYSSRVMFSKNDDMFRIPGSGGHLIASWDLHKLQDQPQFQRLRFRNLPELTRTKRKLLHSCCTTEHLVESSSTGETFLVKWYRKATANGTVEMKTKALMVFKLDGEGNAVYTQDIGDLCIYLSKSEPFCVPASSFPGLYRNRVELMDVDEYTSVFMSYSSIQVHNMQFLAPYHIPPQNKV